MWMPNVRACTYSSAKSRSLVASMLFAVGAVKLSSSHGDGAIERERCASHCTGAQRAIVQTLRAIRNRLVSRSVISM